MFYLFHVFTSVVKICIFQSRVDSENLTHDAKNLFRYEFMYAPVFIIFDLVRVY